MATDPVVRRLLAPPRRPAGRKLAMRRATTLRESVLLAFARTIRYARAVARRAASDPQESVHEYRKSIRRARAVVSLLRPALGKKAARSFSRELRRAFAETGALRDADVLLASLRLVESEDPALPEIATLLEREGRSDGGEAARALEKGSEILKPLPASLRVMLPESFSMEDLDRGLTRSDRRVRATLDRALETKTDADFHEWRKRVKELRYQVEMLASSGSHALKKREKKLDALAEDLGEATDLILLERALAERVSRGEIPDAPELTGTIHSSIAERSRNLLARGREMFADAPADFAREVLAERG
ncbi:MAG: CHAD domain-containing protein [Syntrophomonadaceae bacterium]